MGCEYLYVEAGDPCRTRTVLQPNKAILILPTLASVTFQSGTEFRQAIYIYIYNAITSCSRRIFFPPKLVAAAAG